MELTRRQVIKLGSVAGMGIFLAACGGNSGGGGGSEAAPSGDVKDLTVEPGKLTVATGNPAWEPWVMNDDPESGEGFEAALIYALAEKMGFAAEEVVWTRTEFDEAFAPGEHDWDLNIQQVSINEDRAKAVDFSPAYFVPTQALIVRGDGKFANATTCAEFDGATIAVMVGTTADTFVAAAMPGAKIEYFNNNSDAAAAVTANQADGLVTDTPQAVYMAESGQVENGIVVGQIPDSSDAGLGITLPLGSPLTPYVTDAMNAILDDGTVQGLIDTWLKAYTSDIPVLA
jgi:polar amino acid transport system substrate-binding protein